MKFHIKSSIPLILIVIVSWLHQNANGQYENVWAFGTHRGLDFNNGEPVPIKTAIKGSEANASVCDASGNLLFYTEGSYVWNRNGNLMPNGAQLTDIKDWSTGLTPTSSSLQGALIVPIPETDGLYYIFSLTSLEFASQAYRLYYSVVDMKKDNGLGDIVADQKAILLDSNLSQESVIAVTGDRCNIWLVTYSLHGFPKPLGFKSFEITKDGINRTPVISPVLEGSDIPRLGYLAISPDRTKIVNGSGVFNFNALTGIVSPPDFYLDLNTVAAACFSSNSKCLYVTDWINYDIIQYDLSLPSINDINKSRILLGSAQRGTLKLGPDNKVYFSPRGKGDNTLGRINMPNLVGSACNYQEEVIKFDFGKSGLVFPNLVPILHVSRDTFLKTLAFAGPCFANAQPFPIHAYNSTNGTNYKWNDGTLGASRSVNKPGVYWVTYNTLPCNFHIDSIHVSFSNGVLPDINVTPTCKNNNNGKAYASTYAEDTVSYFYTWQDAKKQVVSLTDTLANATSGWYSVQIQTVNCDTLLNFFIPEESYKVSFQSDSIVCQDKGVLFQNTSDPHFDTFQWQFGDSMYSDLKSPMHVYRQEGKYTAMLIGIGDVCQDTVYRDIIVDALPSTLFKKDRNQICIGERVSFYPKTSQNSIQWSWDFGEGQSMFTKYEDTIVHSFASIGLLPVTLTTKFRACPDTSFTDTVTVYPLPIVNLGSDSFLCMNGNSLLLKNLNNEMSGSHSYLWNTGDTTSSISVKHPGIYSLTIRTQPSGCLATEMIVVKKSCYTDIPNVFTPNGDGVNDYFFPRQLLSKKVQHFRLQIFNRWGQRLFETTSIDGRGWDGRFNGKEQTQGVYIYHIEIEFIGGSMERHNGDVILIK